MNYKLLIKDMMDRFHLISSETAMKEMQQDDALLKKK
jgi:hypothetical protein